MLFTDKVNQTQLQVTIDGTKVIDCETERTMNRVIVHDLIVERGGHILQASYDGKVMQFSSMKGETACEFQVASTEKLC